MAIEITDEMRKAVYAADCLAQGHVFNFGSVVSSGANNGNTTIDVQAPDPDEMPHLTCYRCGKVWLVMEEPGDGYDDAISLLKSRAKDPTQFKTREERRVDRGKAPGKRVLVVDDHVH